MKRICFVTSEIAPTTWGGCGTLLFNAAKILLDRGYEVIFVLDLPEDYFDRFQNIDRPSLLHPERCRAYHVESIVAANEVCQNSFSFPAAWRAYRYHVACMYVANVEDPDIIEFHDFLGVGHYALTAKALGLCYQNQHLIVRLHTSTEVMDIKGEFSRISADNHFVHDLERSALQLAESIVFPSISYLREDYCPFYTEWFGNVIESQSPLIDVPRLPNRSEDPHIILFYGRLFSVKGVDVFIDAAVEMLRRNSEVRFVIAGYDSRQPPDGSSTYEYFLRRKIPLSFQSYFNFVGQVNRSQLESLLPSVRFAVFPNRYESFCYAAHELYAAGIPLIVSNIPGFKDFFENENNALVFDGTVDDLTEKMMRLWNDSDLRQRLTFPYPVVTRALGDIYDAPPKKSWIITNDRSSCSVLICIVGDCDQSLQKTAENLRNIQKSDLHVIHLRPVSTNDNSVCVWMLGQMFEVRTLEGNVIMPTQVRTEQALLLLRSGDRVDPDFIRIACNTIARQHQIGFVGAWHRVLLPDKSRIENFPFDASPELLPFLSGLMLNRFVLRTSPGRMLIDVFDPKVGRCGEIAYIWDLDARNQRGLIIPEPLIERSNESYFVPSPRELSALILRDRSPWHHSRLARLLVWYTDYSKDRHLPNTTGTFPYPEARLWRLVRKVYQMPGYPLVRRLVLSAYYLWKKKSFLRRQVD